MKTKLIILLSYIFIICNNAFSIQFNGPNNQEVSINQISEFTFSCSLSIYPSGLSSLWKVENGTFVNSNGSVSYGSPQYLSLATFQRVFVKWDKPGVTGKISVELSKPDGSKAAGNTWSVTIPTSISNINGPIELQTGNFGDYEFDIPHFYHKGINWRYDTKYFEKLELGNDPYYANRIRIKAKHQTEDQIVTLYAEVKEKENILYKGEIKIKIKAIISIPIQGKLELSAGETAIYTFNIPSAYSRVTWSFNKNHFETIETSLNDNRKIQLKAKGQINNTNSTIAAEGYIEDKLKYIGKVNVQIKATEINLINENQRFVDLNNIVTYKLTNTDVFSALKIKWINNDNLQLLSGQNSSKSTFKTLWNGSGNISALITFEDNTTLTLNNYNNLWIGTPISENKTFTTSEREPILIAADFQGIDNKYPYTWELLSGNCSLSGIQNDTVKVNIKSTPFESDIIKIKITGRNPIGATSYIYTIIVKEKLGSSFNNPLILDLDQRGCFLSKSETQDTYLFGNRFGNPRNEIYYKFKITDKRNLNINQRALNNKTEKTCIYLLDQNKNILSQICDNKSNSLLEYLGLEPGEYYLIAERSLSEGLLETSIDLLLPGSYYSNPILVKTENQNAIFSYVYDTEICSSNMLQDFTNGREVYYKIESDSDYVIEISNLGSGIPGIYTHLITYNDLKKDYEILMTADGYSNIDEYFGRPTQLAYFIEPGKTYYVVSEGYKSSNSAKINGRIKTTITFSNLVWEFSNKTRLKHEVDSENTFAYPNPFRDYISVKSDKDVIKIELYNSLGVLMKSSNNNNTLFTNDIPKGIYIIKIYNSDEQHTFKLIKN